MQRFRNDFGGSGNPCGRSIANCTWRKFLFSGADTLVGIRDCIKWYLQSKTKLEGFKELEMVNGIIGAEHGFSILYMCIIENFFLTGKN